MEQGHRDVKVGGVLKWVACSVTAKDPGKARGKCELVESDRGHMKRSYVSPASRWCLVIFGYFLLVHFIFSSFTEVQLSTSYLWIGFLQEGVYVGTKRNVLYKLSVPWILIALRIFEKRLLTLSNLQPLLYLHALSPPDLSSLMVERPLTLYWGLGLMSTPLTWNQCQNFKRFKF